MCNILFPALVHLCLELEQIYIRIANWKSTGGATDLPRAGLHHATMKTPGACFSHSFWNNLSLSTVASQMKYRASSVAAFTDCDQRQQVTF